MTHTLQQDVIPSPKKVILGLGNTIHGDDGIGIRVVQELHSKLSPRVAVYCTEEMGLALLDYLSGYQEAILIDSVVTGEREVGELHQLSLEDFIPQVASNHYIGLPELALMANKLSVPFPEKISIIGIEVENPYDITTSLSPKLAQKFAQIVAEIEKVLCSFYI